jgi:hypothetical protein
MQAISGDIGFTVTSRIQIYETEPAEPPGEKPRGYEAGNMIETHEHIGDFREP